MADYTLAQQISGSLLSDVDADVRLGGLDDINIDTNVAGRLDSAVTADATVKTDSKLVSDSKVSSDSVVKSDSTVKSDSRIESSVDLAPVAVDSCIRVELGSLPPTQLHTPWHQRLGLSVFGLELFAWTLSGESTTTLRPVPRTPQLIGSVEQAIAGGPGHGHGDDHDHGHGHPGEHEHHRDHGGHQPNGGHGRQGDHSGHEHPGQHEGQTRGLSIRLG